MLDYITENEMDKCLDISSFTSEPQHHICLYSDNKESHENLNISFIDPLQFILGYTCANSTTSTTHSILIRYSVNHNNNIGQICLNVPYSGYIGWANEEDDDVATFLEIMEGKGLFTTWHYNPSNDNYLSRNSKTPIADKKVSNTSQKAKDKKVK